MHEKEITERGFEQQRNMIEAERVRLESLKMELEGKNKFGQSLSSVFNLSQRSDLEQAGDFLDEEFKKGQDFFRIKIDDLLFEKSIGSGASADVFKGSYKEMDVAVKKLRFEVSQVGPTSPIKEFKREV